MVLSELVGGLVDLLNVVFDAVTLGIVLGLLRRMIVYLMEGLLRIDFGFHRHKPLSRQKRWRGAPCKLPQTRREANTIRRAELRKEAVAAVNRPLTRLGSPCQLNLLG